MAYSSNPVKIPEVAGKISFMKKTDRTYVRYEFGRTYNPEKKSTVPQRAIIGMQIRNAPTLMLPNENFEKYFSGDGKELMTAKERKTAEEYAALSDEFWTLNGLFEQLYYEFQFLMHKSPHDVVGVYQIRLINRVLEPMKRMMEGEPYAAFLSIPAEPVEVCGEIGVDRGNEKNTEGLDYSDVGLLLTQYRGAMRRFTSNVF